MRFDFYPLRFEFTARDSICFPPGKSGNIIRGALGMAAPAEIFRPVQTAGPSGLADPPRSFVLRTRPLDGRTVAPNEVFSFDMHIFSLDRAIVDQLLQAVAAIAERGFGPGRGKAALSKVHAPTEPRSLDLDPRANAPSRVRIEFLSPTELKHNNALADRPDFPILFARIRDRISTLRALYGPGPLEIDFEAIGKRAATIRLTSFNGSKIHRDRSSSRTGQTHCIGGFTGAAEYEGDLGEFLPYLEAACWTGIGRHAVWGKGEIAIAPIGG